MQTNHTEIKKYVCFGNTELIEAMSLIDSNTVGLVYVLDSNESLVGCLTDGDIRRFIIKNGDLNAAAKEAMNLAPKFIKESEASQAIEIMKKERIYSLAVVDDAMVIKDIVFLEEFLKIRKGEREGNEILKDTSAIIMAGGKGTRLYPYTRILPKPLIPIGDVPILERIFNRLSSYGIVDIYLTVNYKKEMIKSYFSESDHPYRIHYVEEDQPMGTAGSISLIEEKFDKPVIITNCDILIEADYGNMMKYHLESGNDITIVSSLKNTVIPYGVLHSDEPGQITSMEEKPQITHLINTGMYIINPEFLEWIPKDRVFHMTDLVELMIQKKKHVGMYPISENAFLDMGELEEMKKMEERLMREDRNLPDARNSYSGD